MSDYLLIDGNSVGFAAQAMRKLHTANGQEIQAVYGFLRSIRALMQNDPTAIPIVFWDGHSWRYKVFEEYKDGREKDAKQKKERDAYKSQRPIIAKFLSTLGVEQMFASNMEADDLIALEVLDRTRKPSQTCTVVSGDRDLLQLVNPYCDWLNPIGPVNGKAPKLLRVTNDSFAEDTGYESANDFVKGKALLGDTSDNLKGVDGIGQKAAPMVVKSWPKINEMIEDLRVRGAAAVPAPLSRYKKKLIDFANSEEAQRRFVRNYHLMRLTPSYIPAPENLRHSQPKLAPNAFKILCKEYGFVSLLKDTEDWLEPFSRHELDHAA